VYENMTAVPRAYLVPEVRAVSGDSAALAAMRDPGWDPRRVAFVNGRVPDLPDTPLSGVATITSADPDRIVVATRSDRAALLVLADNYLDGWTVHVDGEAADLLRVNHTFRGVVAPAGEHEIVFAFQPAALRIGFAVYLTCGALLCVWLAWLAFRYARTRAGAGRPATA
ncbi:MAG: YfhO family protein, partial [Planctomycetaceae bacterium]